jgi:predicted ester cyclase
VIRLAAAFTDYRFTTTVGPLADEDKVAGRWLFRGTYQGGMPGASPAAVGKQVEYAGIDLFRVELGKSSNIGCVQTFCNCCNKSG